MRISDWSSDVCSSDLVSALRVRRNIVQAARLTALAFDTEHAERPQEFWDYSEERGFTVKDGARLIEALQKRSEEHTSELQSLMRISYAVFCLKKKKHNKLTQLNAHKMSHSQSEH